MTNEQNNLDLNRESQAIWDANANWWDDKVGPEGNLFHRALIGPAEERLLEIRAGEVVLDIACGNGQFARRMAELGASVVAFDASPNFVARARGHTEKSEYADKIEYHVMDATDESALLSLGEGKFDAAVCTMALMDMAEIDPMLRALSRLLKKTGRFVFSVTHPCFNHTGIRRVGEEEDRDGELVTTYGVKVVRYLSHGPSRGLGIVGQPVPQIYFDRTLSDLFGRCFSASLVMDGLEEPVYEGTSSTPRPLSWDYFREIPPVLVARFKVAQ